MYQPVNNQSAKEDSLQHVHGSASGSAAGRIEGLPCSVPVPDAEHVEAPTFPEDSAHLQGRATECLELAVLMQLNAIQPIATANTPHGFERARTTIDVLKVRVDPTHATRQALQQR